MRREYTNQHGVFVPTENEAVKNIYRERRKRVRNTLRRWGKADKENERLKEEYQRINIEINALRGLQALAMDGLPHGNKITHPTEDSAIEVMDILERKRNRMTELMRRITENETLLTRINLAMVVAKNSDILKMYYRDHVRPMTKLAAQLNMSERSAWALENDGVDSIADIL